MLQSLARSLDLSDAEYMVLLKVRDELRSGELVLDMRNGCACIAGHMGYALGIAGNSGASYTQFIGSLSKKHPMRQLCYPPQPNWHVNGYDATPGQAADAIDRMLVGAEPWPSR